MSYLISAESEIPMTSGQENWVAAVVEIGSFLSTFPSGYLINYVGRKSILLASGPLYILTWILVMYMPSVLVLGIVRLFQGTIMGAVFTAGPIYLGEIASDSTRGAITSLFFNSWWVGSIISYIVGPLLDFTYYTWFTLAMNIPFILIFFWQPETPYYYIMTGNLTKAKESLEWFRDEPTDKLKDELEEIKWSVETRAKRSARMRDLLATAADRRAFTLLMVVSAVRVCSGTVALQVYSTNVFDLTPNLSISSNVVTVSFGIVMLMGGCVSSFTLDTFGRRPLLLISLLGCLICTFLTGTYYYLLTDTSIEVSQFSWIAPILILSYSGLCSAGMYPICTAYTSELFGSNTRGLASGCGTAVVTVFSFLSLITFSPVTDWLGLYANFFIYTLTALFGFLYFYFYAPETKGKSFVQIRNELCDNIACQNGSTVINDGGQVIRPT